MKAKDLLLLYEDTQFSGDDAYSLIHRYLLKKFKVMGAVPIVSLGQNHIQFKIPLSEKPQYDSIQKYLKRLSKHLEFSNVEKTTFKLSLYCKFPYSGSYNSYPGSIFSIRVGYNQDNLQEVIVLISFTENFIMQWKKINRLTTFNEFLNEVQIQRYVYPLIDSIAKALRLVPFEV